MKRRTFKLDKLVRDKIVQHHLAMDGQVDYKTVQGKSLTQALLKKIIEEAQELKGSDLQVGEVTDLKELVDSLSSHLGIKKVELSKRQKEKRAQNGAFKKGHYINTVTLPARNKWAKYYAADPKRFPEIKD